ncbi:Rho GTPase-activating protein gacII [Taenia solium]|eukprot:TsM_000285900 transcript=TsM_000285900 gene=TsM_000285900
MLIGKENQAYAACFDYGQRLLEAVQETPEVNDFRIRCPGKFRSICFLHLSFAIDVPLNLFHEFNSSDQTVNVPSGRRMFSRLRRCNGGDFQTLPLTPGLLEKLIYLMTMLESTGGFQAEGVFRKTGSLIQQRTVTEALLHPDFNCTAFGWTEFSPHELAGALKSIISHLAQPLLTSTLTPLFLEASRLWGCEEKGKENMSPMDLLAYGKQVKSLRLLVQLLPAANRTLLKQLLRLLGLVSEHVMQSRMTSVALGTVFGPVFVPSAFGEAINGPQCKNSNNFKNRYQGAILLATRLIELNKKLFLLPTALLEDIRHNAKGSLRPEAKERQEDRDTLRCSPYRWGRHLRRSSSPLQTSVRFASLSSISTSVASLQTPPPEGTVIRDVSNATPPTATTIAESPTNNNSMSAHLTWIAIFTLERHPSSCCMFYLDDYVSRTAHFRVIKPTFSKGLQLKTSIQPPAFLVHMEAPL